MPSRSTKYASLLLAAAALSACNSSSAGKLTEPMPTAVVMTIGQPFVVVGTGGLTTTVRAGADVVLTAKNSYKGANDTGVPIIDFAWKRIDTGTDPVTLVTRTNNTVTFTAPEVLTATLLKFQLTVTDSNGNSSSAEADVTVMPLRDADHFLKYEFITDTFTVGAVTDTPLAPTGAASNVTIPFTVTITKIDTFTDSNGIVQTVQVGTPQVLSSGWNASVGNNGNACNDVLTPSVKAHIPTFEVDDVITDASSPFLGQPVSNLMQLSDVDLDPPNPAIPPAYASAKIVIAYAPVAAGDAAHVAAPAGTNALACVGGIGPATSASLTMKSEDLYLAMNENSPSSPFVIRDNAQTASLYYATIDPTASKTDLASWLTLNGFDPAAADYGASAKPASIYHATYTNNYDLGFGRDMYLSVGPCDVDVTNMPLQQQISHCDVASVVVNYLSVEAAIKRINPINAVAMEYTGPKPGVGPRFVKFYTFAPDTRTGRFLRVTSVDLDHRGQKYMPAACTVCHGGQPNQIKDVLTAGKYLSTPNFPPPDGPSGVDGDVNASFLPWDLDSFLYSDTDPGFSNKPQDAAIKAQYTRAKQEPQFKLLNSGTYLTLSRATNPAEQFRFVVLQELLEGWYAQNGSGAGLPGSFNGAFVPPGWQEANNGNPKTTATSTGSAAIYTDVYMRNCRTCHVGQAPRDAYNPLTGPQCSLSMLNNNTGRSDQYPVGCYYGFVQTTNMAALLSEGLMPSSRRTMDRLWADPAGGAPKGQELIDHLNVYFQTPGAVNIQGPPQPVVTYNAVVPGVPNVSVQSGGFPGVVSGCGTTPLGVNCQLGSRLYQPNLSDNNDSPPGTGDLLVQPTWLFCLDDGSGSCANAARFPVIAPAVNQLPPGSAATLVLPVVTTPSTVNFLLEFDAGGKPVSTAKASTNYQ